MGIAKECKQEGCNEPARSRGLCVRHYRRWNRQAPRCAWDGCANFTEDGGRKLGNGLGRKKYCREHEGQHLTANAEIDALNRARLGNQLYPEGECWFGVGEEHPDHDGRYVLFEPVGARKAKWFLHRAVYAYLLGGHPQRIGKNAQRVELDHLAGCALGEKCAAPFHLEPVTSSENKRRKHDRSGVPPVNWEVATNPRVRAFALEFNLPLPVLEQAAA